MNMHVKINMNMNHGSFSRLEHVNHDLQGNHEYIKLVETTKQRVAATQGCILLQSCHSASSGFFRKLYNAELRNSVVQI